MSVPSPRGIKPVARSAKLYERLLALYPRNHREEYGAPMVQLFCDQCGDAWAERRWWGLAGTWVRALVDLIMTSTAEHLRNLKQRKPMLSRILLAFRTNPNLRTTFLVLFTIVFLVVLGSSALLAFLTPKQYASTARFTVERRQKPDTVGQSLQTVGAWDPYFIQAEMSAIQSDQILGTVADTLHLTEAGPQLRARISLIPFRNSNLIQLVVYDQSAARAALIANAIADTYRNSVRAHSTVAAAGGVSLEKTVEIVDRAEPALRPVRPNQPLVIFLGIFGGVFLAFVGGGVGALVASLSRRPSRPFPATA